MATININRRMNDDYNRYTMPRIQIKTQGSTTILTNLDVIAKKLDRSPIHILKFFAYKFSTSVIVDEQKNLFAFGGIRDRDVLQNHLYTFIDHFVICSECDNPETKLILRKQKTNEVFKKCLACGAVTPSKMQAEKTIKFIAKDLLEEENLSLNHSLPTLLQDKSKLNDQDTIQQIMNILTDKSLTLIVKNVFTENVRQEIRDYKNLFQQLCQNNRQAQLDLLSGFEMIITDQKITQAKIIEEILFNLYNEDIIDEDTFHFWYRNCSIRKLANGFIQWLNNAD